MGIKSTIIDGKGTGKELVIDDTGAGYVTETKVPPKDLDVVLRPFATFMTDDGTPGGSTDMRVDGSTTSQDFYIQSGANGDRYIQTLAITIADAAASLNQFGNLSALTTGCQIIYEDPTLGDVILADSLKTNFDFVQLCNFEPTFGTGTAAFLASNVSGSSEAYIPILDLTDVFGLPYGLRLPVGSNKRLILRVNDNTTAVDRFDIKCFGFDRIDKSKGDK